MCKQNVADKREKLGNCPFDCPFPTISLMGLKLRDNRNKHRQFPREFPPGAIVVSRGSYLIFNLWTRQGIRWKDGRYSCIGHRWSFFAMLIKGSREKSCAKLLLRGSVSLYSPNLFVRTEDQGAREKRGCTRNKDKIVHGFTRFWDQQDVSTSKQLDKKNPLNSAWRWIEFFSRRSFDILEIIRGCSKEKDYEHSRAWWRIEMVI